MVFTPKTKIFTSEAGNEYTFQTVPNSVALRNMDQSSDEKGNVSNVQLAKTMLENIVVIPSTLTADDFETLQELQEVVTEAYKFFRIGQ